MASGRYKFCQRPLFYRPIVRRSTLCELKKIKVDIYPTRCGLLAAVARLAVGAGAGPWPPSPGATPRPLGPSAGPRPLAPSAMPGPPATGSRCGPPASSREGHGVLPLSVWVWACERIGRRDEKTRVRILTQPFYTLVGRMGAVHLDERSRVAGPIWSAH